MVRMLYLEHDIDQLSLTEKSSDSSPSPTVPHSAPASTTTHQDEVTYRDGVTERGFFEGLLGCLRPVWTIIGKAAVNELKNEGKDRYCKFKGPVV
ncbi:unnamed protein product [Mytilus coruscus]|uniref:Uncharacterized protein n=1 Tax=Mytilus coruscus TaxID=42192 RepID=A0A6J8DV00_MYTCO|nr:unnamed protein product [Mytilus coruscus]